MEKAVSFKNSKGQKLLGILHMPAKIMKAPAIVCCHGFGRNKVDKFRIWVRIARALCNSGFVVLRFDFSGHGDSEGEMEDISISQEIDDLECAINYLEKVPGAYKNKVGIVGHSLGAEIAILESVKNHFDRSRKAFEGSKPQNQKIKALVLLAPVAGYRTLHKDFLNALARAKKSGASELASHKIKRRYFDELEKFAPLEEIKRVNIPLLVIHGTMDERVDISGSKLLVANANEPKKLIALDGADHDFVGYENTMLVIDETVKWLSEHIQLHTT